MEESFGSIKIGLEQLIQKKGMSKNKVSNLAQMQRTQLNNYCKGKIQRIDLSILSRLCYALDCSIEDILEYQPPTE